MTIIYEKDFFNELIESHKFYHVFNSCLPFRIIIGKDESRVVGTIDKVGTSDKFYDKLIMERILFRINLCFVYSSYDRNYGDAEVHNLMLKLNFHPVGIDNQYVYYMKYFYQLNDILKTLKKIGINASYPDNIYYVDRNNQLQHLSQIFDIIETDHLIEKEETKEMLPIQCKDCEFATSPTYLDDEYSTISLNSNSYYWFPLPYNKNKEGVKVISRVDLNHDSINDPNVFI